MNNAPNYLISLILFFSIQGCAFYHGKPSENFDGMRFYGKDSDNSFIDHVTWLWQMKTVDWPDWIDDPQMTPPPLTTEKGQLRITHINQSTVLIQMDGLNILTDPVWSNRVGPFSWAGVPRIRNPGIRMDDLPPIHMILISHDHYDHLDLPTIKQLVERHHPFVIVGLGVKKRLDRIKGIEAVELDWWQACGTQNGISVTFVPARHSSGRGVFDGNKTLWGGFVMEGFSGNVLFMGDTAYGDFFKDIKQTFSPFRLAILPIGSYEERWFMKSQHMNPAEAVDVHKELCVMQSMGVHFATFCEHPEMTVDTHEKDLLVALKTKGVPDAHFWIPKFGESREIP